MKKQKTYEVYRLPDATQTPMQPYHDNELNAEGVIEYFGTKHKSASETPEKDPYKVDKLPDITQVSRQIYHDEKLNAKGVVEKFKKK